MIQYGPLVLLQSLNCHGSGSQWLAALIAVPPTIVAWEFQPQSADYAPSTAPLVSSPAFPPPVPPPRPLAG